MKNIHKYIFQPEKRLGNSFMDAIEIKQHEFYKEIDWEALKAKKIKSPMCLIIKNDKDLNYFDKVNKF